MYEAVFALDGRWDCWRVANGRGTTGGLVTSAAGGSHSIQGISLVEGREALHARVGHISIAWHVTTSYRI